MRDPNATRVRLGAAAHPFLLAAIASALVLGCRANPDAADASPSLPPGSQPRAPVNETPAEAPPSDEVLATGSTSTAATPASIAPTDPPASATPSPSANGGPTSTAVPDPRVAEAVAEARERLRAIGEARAQRDLATARAEAGLAVRALLSSDATSSDAEVGHLLETLGDVAFQLGALETAEAARRSVYERLEAALGPDEDRVRRARENLAQCLYARGDTAGALELARRTLATLERTSPQDGYELAITRLNVAAGIKANGDLQGARLLEQAVVATFERTRSADDSSLQLARMNLASTLYLLGELAEARALEERALEAMERTLPDDDSDLQALRLNLSDLMRSLGEAEGSRALAEKALAVFERTLPDEHPDVQAARLVLASACIELGDLLRARALAERALEVRERTLPEHHPDLQRARGTLARILRKSGDVPAARALYERVLAAVERSLPPEHPQVLDARLNLASTLRDLSELDAAGALAARVVEDAERTLPEGHTDLQRARSVLGATMVAKGDAESAYAIARTVLEARERTLPADHFDVVAARVSLAASSYFRGELAEARALLEDAIRRWEHALAPDSRDLATALDDLAWVAAGARDARALDRALAGLVDGVNAGMRALSSVSAREARDRVHSLSRRVWTILSLEPSSAGPEWTARVLELVENLRIQSVSRPLVDAHASDVITRDLRASALVVRRKIFGLVAAGSGAADGSQLESLVRERDAIDAQLSVRLSELGVSLPEMSVASLAAALPPDACAIAFRRYTRVSIDAEARHRTTASDRLLAHCVTPAGRVTRVELGPMEDVAAAVEAWRAAIGRPFAARGRAVEEREGSAADERAAGARLRELVLDPLRSAIGDSRVLHVCADDALHLAPLDALPLDAGIVGDRVRIVNELDFGRLLTPRPARTATGALFVGGVDYDAQPAPANDASAPRIAAARVDDVRARSGSGAWPHLAGSLAEVERIGAVYREAFGRDAALLTGAAASKPVCVDRARGARFVHFATHGYFAPESLRDGDVEEDRVGWSPMSRDERVLGFAPMALCGLALAGANLDVDALARANGLLTAEELAGVDLSACELAVLSACDTSVGITRAGQGVRSLQSALHAAGAASAITSVWKVDDERARELFEDFYARIWSRGEGRAQALWNAKSALRTKGYPTRDWAGWMLTGDPD